MSLKVTNDLLNQGTLLTIPSFLKCNSLLPSITSKPLVFPYTSLAIPFKFNLLSFLLFCKCPLSPVLHHWTLLTFIYCPLAFIVIYTLMTSTLLSPWQVSLMSFRLTWPSVMNTYTQMSQKHSELNILSTASTSFNQCFLLGSPFPWLVPPPT